jgi:putative membrane protein
MRRVKALATLAVLGLGLCLAGMSTAADDQKKDRGDNQKGGDQEFVQKATACGLAEENLGNLAARLSTNPAVQQFAQRVAQDHATANRQLLQIANQRGLRPATTMDKKHQDLMTQLGKSEGAQFDRSFMKQLVQDHEEAVKLFEREAKDGKDPALKQFASQTLPALRAHLKMARDVADRVGAGERGGEKGGGRDRDRDKDKGRDRDK